jgi:hypothetical protein
MALAQHASALDKYSFQEISMKLKQIAAAFIGTVSLLYCCGAHATILDLTTLNASGDINFAKYTQTTGGPAGSGVLDTFSRIQAKKDDGGVEEGYNTNLNGQLDNKDGGFTHVIKVEQIGFVAGVGGQVMRFILDIAEPIPENKNADKRFLNLDEVQIFISTNGMQASLPSPGTGLLALASSWLVYRMDGGIGGDNTVVLNAANASGNGQYDMTLDIPISMFDSAFLAGGFSTAAAKNGAFLYLYSRFGSDPYAAEGSFEEWAGFKGAKLVEPPCTSNCGGQEVPEPGGISLLAVGLVAVAVSVRRRRKPQS